MKSNLREHGKGHTKLARHKLFDRCLVARFLLSELVARKTQYNEPFGLILLVYGLEILVLRGQASFRGYVHDQSNAAFEVSKVDVIPVYVLCRERPQAVLTGSEDASCVADRS